MLSAAFQVVCGGPLEVFGIRRGLGRVGDLEQETFRVSEEVDSSSQLSCVWPPGNVELHHHKAVVFLVEIMACMFLLILIFLL